MMLTRRLCSAYGTSQLNNNMHTSRCRILLSNKCSNFSCSLNKILYSPYSYLQNYLSNASHCRPLLFNTSTGVFIMCSSNKLVTSLAMLKVGKKECGRIEESPAALLVTTCFYLCILDLVRVLGGDLRPSNFRTDARGFFCIQMATNRSNAEALPISGITKASKSNSFTIL